VQIRHMHCSFAGMILTGIPDQNLRGCGDGHIGLRDASDLNVAKIGDVHRAALLFCQGVFELACRR